MSVEKTRKWLTGTVEFMNYESDIRQKSAASRTFFITSTVFPCFYQMSINVRGLITLRAFALKVSGTVIINLKRRESFIENYHDTLVVLFYTFTIY